MEIGPEAAPDVRPDEDGDRERRRGRRTKLVKWAVVVSSAAAIALTPVPSGVTPQSWRLLAIFVATIIGSILRPVPSAAIVLLGVTAVALTGVLLCERSATRLRGPCGLARARGLLHLAWDD